MADIASTIEDAATGPKKVSGDEGSVEMHSIQDQIAAAKFVANKNATSNGQSGFSKSTMAKARFPGTA